MTKIATTFTSETPTLAEQLRAELAANERDIASMNSPAAALDVITRQDRIEGLLAEIRQTRYDARTEMVRADALRERLSTRDAPKAAKLARAGGHAAQLADSATWQTIAATDATLRQQRTRRLAIAGGALEVVAVLLFVVLPWVFPPAPQADLNETMRLAYDGQIDAALALAQAEYARVPSDPASLIWIGALQAQKNDASAAQATWAQARREYNDDPLFFNDRALARLQLRDYVGAETDARQMLAEPRVAPQGQFLLGQVFQAQGKPQEAIAAYEQAARLADEQNIAQVAVAARTQIAFMLQRPPAAPQPTP